MNKKLIKVSNALLLTEFKHIFRVMKLTSLFGVLCVSSAFAINVNSQSLRVNIHANQKQAKEVIKQIEEQTDYLFVYNHDKVNLNNTVTIQANNETVAEVLNQMFAGTDIIYAMQGNNILLMQKDAVVQQSGKVVTGTIVDPSGMPVIGANVMVKGTTNGTITDMDGKFSLEVEEGATLQISYIGYANQEIKVGNQKTLSIALKEDAEALDELVVVGYGTQKKVNLTGAVSSVSSKELESRPMSNLGQGLQGLVPNVNISMPTNGNPGQKSSFNIRGTTSLTGGEPLILVDGVQMDPNMINPADIESISFLKDAASSSIYGARAAYGVMLITTKRGKESKPRISYSNNIAINSPTFLPKMQNSLEWAETINRGFTNLGNNPFVSDLWLQHIKDYMADPENTPNWYPDPNGYVNGGHGNFNYCDNVDYIDAVYDKMALMQQHTVSLQGGTEKMKYYASVGYNQQNGFLKYTDDTYRRLNTKMRFFSHLTDWLNVGVNFSYNISGKENPSGVYWGSNPDAGRSDFSSTGGFWGGSWPVIALVNSGYAGLEDSNPSYNMGWTNPVQLQRDSGRENRTINDLWLGANIDITPIPNLNIHADYTHNIQSNTDKMHVKKMKSQDPISGEWVYLVHAKDNWVTMENGETNYSVLNATADYSFNIDRHNFKVLAGLNYEKNHYRWFWARKMGLINNDLPAMNQATGLEKTNYSENEWALLGYFGRLNYNFDERYLFEFNIRYDGSSRFPTGNKFAWFPSFSAGWNLSNEAFWENLQDYVNSAKIRGSWGSLGHSPSSIGLYPYIPTLGTKSQLNHVINGVRPVGVTPAGLVASMTWETVRQWNIAADLGFLNNRLTGSFDYYQRATIGMIGSGTPLPAVLGTGVPQENASDLMTKGYELTLSWKDHIGDDFQYNVGLVFSDYKSEITKFDNPSGLLSTHRVGETIGEIWGYHSDGVFQTDEEAAAYQEKYDLTQVVGRPLKAGDVRYLDINGDGKVTPGLTTSNRGDMSVIGNTSPRYMYGINLGAGWKGIDLRVFLQGVGRQDVNLSGYSNLVDQWKETYSYMNDTWTPENPDAFWPRVTVGDGSGANTQTRTSAIQNAGYLRLKDVTVGYTLPKPWVNKLSLDNVRIYFSGYNLLTLTGLHDGLFDPETKNTYAYPIYKSVSFGIDIVL